MGNGTLAPTPKRLREAKARGQVGQGRLLVSVGAMCGGVLFVWAGGVQARWEDVALVSWSTASMVSVEDLQGLLALVERALLGLLLPWLLGAAVGGALVSFAQVGPVWAGRALGVDAGRLKPKALDVVGVTWRVVGALVGVVWGSVRLVEALATVSASGRSGFALGFGDWASLWGEVLWPCGVWFLVVALVDALWQRRRWREGLMMTREEVKDEARQQQGDPEIKRRRRRLHGEGGVRGVLADAALAQVVVYHEDVGAVALGWVEGWDEAPRVLVCAFGGSMEGLLSVARGRGVPLWREMAVMRALVGVDAPGVLPSGLFRAVARIFHRVGVVSGEDVRGKSGVR